MAEQHIEWTTPAPLWPAMADPLNSDSRRGFRTPAILRFSADSFMEDFLEQMNQDPALLPEFVAAPETWKAPPSEPAKTLPKTGLALRLERTRTTVVRKLQARNGTLPTLPALPPDSPILPLKLYQPSHQRFYLVAGCLVCRVLGLPDRRVNTSIQERVTFVLRLLYPRANAAVVNPDPADCDELAYVKNVWQVVSTTETLLPGEEQNPLSPVTYGELDGRKRRLWVGLLPTGKREALLGASRPAPAGEAAFTPPIDARQIQFKTLVLGPWANLEAIGSSAAKTINTKSQDTNQKPDPTVTANSIKKAEDQIVSVSWYVLLDFAKYLDQWIKPVWETISSNTSGTGLSGAEQQLVNRLRTTRDPSTQRTLAQALQNAKNSEQALEAVTVSYASGAAGWPSPSLIFPLAVVGGDGVKNLSPSLSRTDLETLIVAALPALGPTQTLPVKAVAQASASPHHSPWFSVRFVFERPNCGVLTPPMLSEPTASFKIAAFFDPDAPARPVRIGMPADTTPAGLRKFDKNTGFVLSDLLCKQKGNVGDGKSFLDLVMSVLPFPFHQDLDGASGGGCTDKDGASIGMVCSLSIPIITLCAFFLLMIFIKLLDIVFFWMPFFQICLPVPKFKGKGE